MKYIFITLLLFASAANAVAQQPAPDCVTNRNAPPANSYYWPPDTNVKVYFMRGMFTPEQREMLFAAMSTWSEAAKDAGANVTFSYAGETEKLSPCNACLTVTRRDVHKHDNKHYAFFNPLEQDHEGLLVSAWIDFDFATTNPQALLGFMTHELGHSLGLWDCTTCKKKQTIMNGFPGINRDNGLAAPSLCDREVVRNVYELHRRVENNPVGEKRKE
ncbi:MAG TPA: hypothetical protein VJ749_09320 [Pyrinomonadaceae bacterium]|nr:hypothetical protein [Pyrinomonadaceae bacterium]